VLNEVTPQIIVDSIDEMLVMQRGKELGYKMADEQFASILQNIRKRTSSKTSGVRSGAEAGGPQRWPISASRLSGR